MSVTFMPEHYGITRAFELSQIKEAARKSCGGPRHQCPALPVPTRRLRSDGSHGRPDQVARGPTKTSPDFDLAQIASRRAGL